MFFPTVYQHSAYQGFNRTSFHTYYTCTYCKTNRWFSWSWFPFLGLTADVIKGKQQVMRFCKVSWEPDLHFLIVVRWFVVIGHCSVSFSWQFWAAWLPKYNLQKIINAYKIQSILTHSSEQTVQIQIRLLPKEHSDQGLHCLPFHLHHEDASLHLKPNIL